MSFKEYAYQSGALLSQYLAGNGVVPVSNSDSLLTRIEQKLDVALAASSSSSAASAVLTYQVVIKADVTAESLSNLKGMDCDTGKLISGFDYLRQRIFDALSTDKGSQVLLRARGSGYPSLIDTPVNQTGALRIVSAAAAVFRDPLCGVPDFSLTKVLFNRNPDVENDYLLTVIGDWLGNTVEVSL
jgi:phage baseplate assembly protein W